MPKPFMASRCPERHLPHQLPVPVSQPSQLFVGCVLGLRYCAGFSLVATCRLLAAVASLAAEPGL